MNKASNQIAQLALTALCMGLCACTTTSETFDCPAGKGVGCQSISAVNRMVNQGVLGEEIQDTQLQPPAFSASPVIPAPDGFSVRRIQEEHLRVWVAPFQDAQGNFHEGSLVHTVVKPGFWQIDDLSHLPGQESR